VTFVVDGTVAALVAIIVQFLLKPLIEIWLSPAAPRHDTTIRAAALLLGVLLLAVETLIGGPWPATGQAWLLLIGGGALSGLASIGGYHALTGSASPTVTSSVVTGEMPTGAANSALNMPERLTFSPSPLHQAAGIAGTWDFSPANARDNAAVPRTLTEAANAGRQGVPASLVPESERTAVTPPAATPPQSPTPGPAADAAKPAQ